MTQIEIATKIIQQGTCSGMKCSGCPALPCTPKFGSAYGTGEFYNPERAVLWFKAWLAEQHGAKRRRFRVYQLLRMDGRTAHPNPHYSIGEVVTLDQDDSSVNPIFITSSGSIKSINLVNLQEIDEQGAVIRIFAPGDTLTSSIRQESPVASTERRFRVYRTTRRDKSICTYSYMNIGDIVTLNRDDGTQCPSFRFPKGGTHYIYMHDLEEIDSEERVIQRFDYGSTFIKPILVSDYGSKITAPKVYPCILSQSGESLSARRKRLLMK